jgi:micrococcal nuclease
MDRTYPGARVVRVVDGDTVILDVDLGFGTWLHGQSFRLRGCNAREHSMLGGSEAAAHLRTLLPVGSCVTLTSIRPDKYGGRYDAGITLQDGSDLVQLLIAHGWVAPWNGKGERPLPAWPRVG